MLANIEPAHNDFHALASYLIHGRDRPTDPKRVTWCFAHNLPTNDPIVAAKIMAATAEHAKRCANACYHTSINWHSDERPSPDIMQEVARRTLALAGLDEHQALVMGHGDKPHAHCHLMINRVHPVTGRAWSTSHDYRRFDRIMRQLSDAYGFQYVPPHSFEPDLTDALPKAPNSNATWAAKRGADTRRSQWSAAESRSYGDRISERLDRGSTWDDIAAVFAEDGLTLEPKGRGYIVGNAVAYTKLSKLGLTMTAHGLAKSVTSCVSGRRRSIPRHTAAARGSRRSIFTVDAVDIARAIGTQADLQHAVQEAVRQRKARIARKPFMEQLMEELKEQWRATTGLRQPRKKGHRKQFRSRNKQSLHGYIDR